MSLINHIRRELAAAKEKRLQKRFEKIAGEFIQYGNFDAITKRYTIPYQILHDVWCKQWHEDGPAAINADLRAIFESTQVKF